MAVSRARWDEHQWKMSVQNEELRRTPITPQQNSLSSGAKDSGKRTWMSSEIAGAFEKRSDSCNGRPGKSASIYMWRLRPWSS